MLCKAESNCILHITEGTERKKNVLQMDISIVIHTKAEIVAWSL